VVIEAADPLADGARCASAATHVSWGGINSAILEAVKSMRILNRCACPN